MKTYSKLFALAGLALLLPLMGHAEGGKKKEKFAKEHPRRAEVIHRENKDKKKFDKDEDKGKITEKQEKKLDREENRMRRQERADAKANGGHITKGEQRQLNKEERGIEGQEKRMEKRDAEKKEGGQ
jgi:hypothetical protein